MNSGQFCKLCKNWGTIKSPFYCTVAKIVANCQPVFCTINMLDFHVQMD